MASLSWTDDDGAAVLQNVLPSPGNRFQGWIPGTVPVGPREHELGTGLPHKYRHRTDYGAQFRLEHIAQEDLDLADRLLAHLENAGAVMVTTEDLLSRTYTAYLHPEASIVGALAMMDARDEVEYVLSLHLLNSVEEPMLCTYEGTPVS